MLRRRETTPPKKVCSINQYWSILQSDSTVTYTLMPEVRKGWDRTLTVLPATSTTHSPTAAVLATRISDPFVRNLTLTSPVHHAAPLASLLALVQYARRGTRGS